jgi:hypothetical protein
MFVMVLISALALLAIGLGIVAFQAQQTAERRRGDAENLMTYMLGEFVEKLRPLGKLELLDDIGIRALNYLSKTPSISMTPVAMEQRAKALQVIAEINISRSNPDKAYEALLLSKEILKKLDTPKTLSPSILKTLGENSFWMGNIHFNRHEWKQAEEYFNQYRLFSERLSSMPNAAEQALAEREGSHIYDERDPD